MPSTGSTTATSPAAVITTGRPDRNSARPRSTATRSEFPNRPDFPFPLMSIHNFPTLVNAGRGQTMNNKNAAPGAFIPANFCILTTRIWQAPSRRISCHGASGSESRSCTMADERSFRLTSPRFERTVLVNGSDGNSSWARIPATFRTPHGSLPRPWEEIFGPLRHGLIDDLVVVGQCGQSIDGRIATPTGHSHYINGEAGLAHLHRLRALVDAVVIGVGTAIADDPQLTVRRVEGPSPARVIVDPNGRLPATARALAADGNRRLVVMGNDTTTQLPQGVEMVRLTADGGRIAPGTILVALAERGFRRILIEGGTDTSSP